MKGKPQLVGKLLYGSGLRIMEALRLRVKDIDSDYSDASFQRAFMLIFGLCPMKVLYTQEVRTLISSKASTSASMAIGPYYSSTCASAVSVWDSQKVMSMARYSTMAVDSSARACSRWPVVTYSVPRLRWQWACSGRMPSPSARARAWW